MLFYNISTDPQLSSEDAKTSKVGATRWARCWKQEGGYPDAQRRRKGGSRNGGGAATPGTTLRLAYQDGGCRSMRIHSWNEVGGVWQIKGGVGIICTTRSCPSCKGMGALARVGGRGGTGMGGGDTEVGRVACAVRRITNLRPFL